MKQLKPIAERIRNELNECGLYSAKNERIIMEAARCQRMIDALEDDIAKRGVMLTNFKYSGNIEQTTQNPNVETLRKYTATLVKCYALLGLGNNEYTIEPTCGIEDFIPNLTK